LCGIAGFTHTRRNPDPSRIRSAVDSLVHRGPNQQGVFESHTVSLGATRLKIIDLDAGDQPLISEGGDTVIAFNGEIYNHREVRRELEQRGHRFRSQTDTETFLAAFIEWDTDCFERLRGMFAVALWTESDKRLVLARDRMGIKPLYIARQDNDLYFGSELKAIFVHPEIGRELSLDGLDCYLSLNYVPGPWTLVEGIEKLEPGHWLEWRAGKVSIEPYWTLPSGILDSPRTRARTPAEAREELDFLLKQSVREHLVSDVPLGLWLSGGIDSTTLLHYAAESSGARLKTFSISFSGHSFDETAQIRQIASRYGTDHVELDLSTDCDLAGTIEQFAHFSDEPTADAGALPAWFLSGLTKKTATVALSGEGADELFGGYLTYRASMLARTARRFPSTALDWAAKAARLWPVSDEKIGFDYKLKRFLEGCRMRPERAHVHWNGTFTDAEKRSLVRPELPGALDSVLSRLAAAGDDLSAYLWFDQKYYLPDDILTKVDRVSMAHAVEVRPPFLDHRIVEFAAALPDDLRMKGSRQKVVLRDLTRGKLPPSILSKGKIGFDIPAHQWFRGPLRPLLRDAVDIASTQYSSLFRIPQIEACVEAHMDRRANLGYHLWGLMTLFLWMKKWRIQTTPLAERERGTVEQVYTSR
jgi:asparagine synthase (glutamine-hydrolysing)